MADISAIRDGLQTRVATIASLTGRTYDTVPQQINPPCAVIGVPSGRYDDDFDGNVSLTVPIFVFASMSSARTGQDTLDAYLASSGSSSIKAAVEGAAISGVDHAVVTGWEAYSLTDYAGTPYLGVQINVEVVA